MPAPFGGFGTDAYADGPGFPFLTNALGQASYANYAADYYRLFAPNAAVNTWTERVHGIVQAGYGAIDNWTAAVPSLGPVPPP